MKKLNLKLIAALLAGSLALLAQPVSAALTFGSTSMTSDGAVTINGVASSTYAIGAAATTGSFTMGAGLTTGSFTLGGASMTSGATTIYGGTGTGAITLTPGTAGTIVIGKTDGTGAITVGSSSGAQTLNLGTGAGDSTVNVATGAGTNVITIGGGTGTVAINSGDWDISTTGAMTGIGAVTMDGLLTASLGATVSGATVSLNASSDFGTNINTGTSSGAVAIGGGSGTVAVNSSDWDISTTGAMTGIGAITMDGTLTFANSETIANGSDGSITFATDTANADTLVFTPKSGGAGTFAGIMTSADLTAERTWTFPNVSGTVVTTGDTGSVTNTMLAGSIDLTAKVTGVLPTANGGTGIAYFTAAGPTQARVYTFPDAAATVLTTNAAVTVAQGGTGVATLTAYAPIFGGTTETGAVQSGTVGSSGEVLTSNGAGALPTFQAIVASLGNTSAWTAAQKLDAGITVDTDNFTVSGTSGIVTILSSATTGNLLDIGSDAGITATGAYAGVDVDLTNVTPDATNPVYGVHVNDQASTTDSVEYGIYVEGTNWDQGLYVVDAVKFDGVVTITEGALNDSMIVSADIKDETIAGGDLATNIAITTSGATAANGGITVDTSQFTVDGTNGNVTIVPPATMTTGTLLSLSAAGALSATGAYNGISVDLTNVTGNAQAVNGIYVNNVTAGAGAEYGIYVEGTGWDQGLYVVDAVKFDGVVTITEGALTDQTIVSADIKEGTIAGGDLATNIAITTTGLITANGGVVQDYNTEVKADAFSAAGLNVVKLAATTANIATITGGVAGQQLTLIFADDVVVTDDNANGANAINLVGTANFTSAADDTLTLVSDGASWFEVARSVNN